MRFRWALAAVMVLAACSGGGGGNNPTVPLLAWGGFRHDSTNAAIGSAITNNKGKVTLIYPTNGGTTASTAAIDNKSQIFIGTRDGMVSLDADGDLRWFANACQLSTGLVIPFGPIQSSPTVTPGRDIVFGTDATATTPGMVFALHERSSSVVECTFAFTPGVQSVRSSAQVQVDARDLSLLSVFIGTGDGTLQAINGIGTPRWSFAPTGERRAITSTTAIDPTGPFYITTPDGILAAADGSGRPLWQVSIGAPPAGPLQASPGVGASIYAIGAGSALFGINPGGSLKWQFNPQAPVLGSPAFASQSIDFGSELLLDTVIYLADVNGLLYGVLDTTGEIWDIQQCSMPDPNAETIESCRMDSCLPDMGTCVNNRCTEAVDDTPCTPDTCIADNHGACTSKPALVPVSSGDPVQVETSPVLSGDFFVVVGTTDGRVCARNVDGTIPGNEHDASNPWLNGCIELGDGLPVRSSPAIGPNGLIVVTTDSGVYTIK
jgi:outer membrane protein assembly factor BamB